MASADDLDAYVPRAASLDSVISPPRGVRLGRTGGAGVPAYARTQKETKTKVWAEVSTGLDVLPPEQAAYTINKEREERGARAREDEEAEGLPRGVGSAEIAPPLRVFLGAPPYSVCLCGLYRACVFRELDSNFSFSSFSQTILLTLPCHLYHYIHPHQSASIQHTS